MGKAELKERENYTLLYYRNNYILFISLNSETHNLSDKQFFMYPSLVFLQHQLTCLLKVFFPLLAAEVVLPERQECKPNLDITETRF